MVKTYFLGLDSVFKWALFLGYMSLWISQGMLVYASRRNGKIEYNYTSVVLITEFTKLLIATSMFLREDGDFSKLQQQLGEHKKTWFLYFIPALLYCFYNNLTFVNLEHFDPTTYFVLSQFRLVVTGILYQILFQKQLSIRQWGSILILCAGCVVKEIHKLNPSSASEVPYFNWGLILVQIFCATFAGVYNEYLLKNEKGVGVNLQNIFMYTNSIIGNVIIMSFGIGGRTLSSAVKWDNIAPILSPWVICIILNSSCMGIATALFLKYLNSLLKSVASALEIVGTAVVSFLVFGTDFGINTVVSVLLVGCGVWLYSISPVKNTTGPGTAPSAEDSGPKSPDSKGGSDDDSAK